RTAQFAYRRNSHARPHSMPQRFGLSRCVLGSQAYLPLEESEYKEIVDAKSHLIDALVAEEKFDLLVENYLELEKSLLNVTADQMVLRNQDYRWFQFQRNLINRRLVNMLSACRGYVDYITRYSRVVHLADTELSAGVERMLNEYRDNSFAFR